MASNACKLLCLVLFLSFVARGYGLCALSYLNVKQTKTGRLVQNKPEWEVRVRNPCKCRFQYAKVSCAGFQSVTPVPTSSLSKSGDICLLNAGNFIFPQVDFVFKYVWDTMFDFKVIDGVIVCYRDVPV
ncbi:unnamed protein product [Microthlaspi erraticum]|uniref:Leucine-rich repeat-containing N-terminal plant-type domain-containing protein n=1 Tax=Microthlaspi erraticum TaxID=1685480 RepID=A0A6D2K1A7_9BRAS|nr:unnamed protein product [Microthlaspi erraticum]CAA7046377.1 unnamed protein product [Microthlaspi erraticum]CAA7057237.1 unnamed protein product [Microthlaspi erraticum]